MGKKGLSDKVRNKQKNKAKQPQNPFEVKVNKIKHSVVNKKVQKWEKGLPGVSRSKAVKKRKDTLLKELHHMKKSNLLLDKRFGENDSTLTADEKMVQRFAMEKKKQMRQNDFNLNEEEEVLTHYGQSLAENLQDTLGSDSEDEDNAGKLRTSDLQFGGFSKEGDEISWKDKMKEVIADSKKQKYERQAEKEKTLEATNELDNSWKTLVSTFKPKQDSQNSKKKVSGFMQLFHNLVLEQKSAGASDKLKTEEEKAKEDAERLKKLEAERIARMKGTKKQENSHTSADDLNDGFALETSRPGVSFAEPGDSEEEEETQEDENKNTEEEQESEDGEDEGDDDEEEEDGDDDEDNYSDLASDDGSESEEEPATAREESVKEKPTKSTPKSILKKSKVIHRNENDEKFEKMVTSALPFVYSAPGSYEELESLLHGHNAEEQVTILSRLRKCHHPSLAEGNKEKLQKIQLYLLQYFGEVAKQQPVDKKLLDHVTISLWEMSQMFQASTAAAVQSIVVERQKDYADSAQKRGGRGTFVDTDTLMYLKLVESLYPTSDFRHPVTTPAIHFITQMLSECPVRNGKDVVSGLFLCSLALKYVSLSKRYIPEVVTFLHGLLFLGAEKDSHSDLKVFPPFRIGGKAADVLKVLKKCLSVSAEWSLCEMLSKESSALDNDEFRCEAVDRCLDLLLECMRLWEDLPSLTFIMEPLKKPLSLLPKSLYPSNVQAKIASLTQKLEDCKSKKLKVMQQPSKKPVPLKLFEPEFQEFWSGKKKKGGPNKALNERQRLNHKYKREMKSAIRELKRDNEVLARHQLDAVLQKDADRKRKTKELMNSLASQEGDYKAIKRMKK